MSNIDPEREIVQYMAGAESGQDANVLDLKAAAYIARAVGQMLADQTVNIELMQTFADAQTRLLNGKEQEEVTPDDGIDTRSFYLGVLVALQDTGQSFLCTKHPDTFRPKFD